MSQVIYENYENFIKEHQDDLNSSHDILRMLSDDGMFRAYIDSLTEGLDPEVAATAKEVCHREREMVLAEAANVPASSFASGWTVMSLI